jgi:transposase InsO family protein
MKPVQLWGDVSPTAVAAPTLQLDHVWEGALTSNHAPAQPQMQRGRVQRKMRNGGVVQTDTGGQTKDAHRYRRLTAKSCPERNAGSSLTSSISLESCQGWGRGFESLRPLQISITISDN